jgi:hypothetical protein
MEDRFVDGINDAASAKALGDLVISLFLWIVLNLVVGCFTGWLAERKGYSGYAWFFLGLFFSVLALLTMVGAPVAPPRIPIIRPLDLSKHEELKPVKRTASGVIDNRENS